MKEAQDFAISDVLNEMNDMEDNFLQFNTCCAFLPPSTFNFKNYCQRFQ